MNSLRYLVALSALALGGCSLLVANDTNCKTNSDCTSPAFCNNGECIVLSEPGDDAGLPDAGGPDAGTPSVVLSVELSGQPVAGQAVSLTVSARDSAGKTVQDYRGSVRFASGDTKAVLPAAYSFSDADKGTHTFPNAVTFRTAGAQFLSATDEASAVITGRVETTVLPGQAQTLSLTGIAAFVEAGAAQTLVVTALDASGNVATGYLGTVQFTSSDPKAALPAASAFAATDNGVKTFTGLVVLKTAGTQSVTATDTSRVSLNGAQSGITVGPGPTAALLVTGIPNSIDAGSKTAVTVSAVDAFGNGVSSYAGTVGFTSTDTRAVLPADYTFLVADNGTKSFPNVELRSVGTWSVTATDKTVSGVSGTQANIQVRLGPPSRLAFLQAPVAAQVNVAISPAVTVAVQDLGGNTIATAANTITVALGANTAGAVLSGTLFHDAVSGVATFADLKLDKQGTGYTLRATSGGLAAGETAPFDASGCPVGYTGPSCTDCIAGFHQPTSEPSKCVDACTDPNPCSSAPAKTCDGNTAVTYTLPGTCTTTASAPHFTCDYPEVRTACGAGKFCHQGDCVDDPCNTNPCVADEATCTPDGVWLVSYAATCTPQTATTRTCKTDNVQSTIDCTALGQGGLCLNRTCTTLPHPTEQEILITEIHAHPAAGATYKWFEVKNLSAKNLNLSGMILDESVGATTFTVPASPPALVLPGGYFVFGASKDPAQNGGAPVKVAWAAPFDLPAAGNLKLRSGTTVLESVDWQTGFPSQSGAAMSLSSRVFAKGANQLAWYWCDASDFVSGTSGEKGTPGADNGDCGVPANPALTWCSVQFPTSLPSAEALVGTEVYGRLYGAGVTSRNTLGNDRYPFVHGELGFGTAKDPATWTWTPAQFNAGYVAPGSEPDKNNDEMMASLVLPAEGTYYYGYRFNTTDAAGANPSFLYCGTGASPVVDPTTPAQWDAFPVATATFTGKSTSKQLAAVIAATDDATVSLPVHLATVTYTKAAVGTGTDGAGFFVQGEPTGPALYVAVDPASLTPIPAKGDQVSFTVTKKSTTGALPYVNTLTGFTRDSTGGSVAAFVKDLNAASDLVTGLAGYAARPLKLTAQISGAFASDGAGFLSAPITTAGMPSGDAGLVLRVPFALQNSFDLVQGCSLALDGPPMWRFNANAQVSAWAATDYTVSGCPLPKIAAAFAQSATSVVVEFNRALAPASLSADGAQFVLDNGATVSAAALGGAGKRVVLTTSALASGTTYQVVVAGTLTDLAGGGIDPTGNTASFPGPGACTGSSVVISQVFGGGGNTGAPYQTDFIELHNRTGAAVSLEGWSVQYASRTSASWNAVALTGSLPAGGYLLVAGASGTNGSPLPTPDVTSTLNLSATDGKVLLAKVATAFTVNCPKTDANVADFVGFGTADCSLGSAAGSPTNAAALMRLGEGCVDTSNNAADFNVQAPTPRNASTAAVGCGCQ